MPDRFAPVMMWVNLSLREWMAQLLLVTGYLTQHFSSVKLELFAIWVH